MKYMLALLLALSACGDNAALPPDAAVCLHCGRPDPVVTCDAGFHKIDPNRCVPEPRYGPPDAHVDAGVVDAP